MRTIHTDEIIKNIKEMCIEANLSLTEDMKCRFKNATESEKSPLGKQILNQLQENMEIAAADQIPICQDTGMAIVFLNIGQDVHIEGMDLHDAVNEGVRQGYTEGYLRKSVVKDPLIRENTKDNTPAIIHIDILQYNVLQRMLCIVPFDDRRGIAFIADTNVTDHNIFHRLGSLQINFQPTAIVLIPGPETFDINIIKYNVTGYPFPPLMIDSDGTHTLIRGGVHKTQVCLVLLHTKSQFECSTAAPSQAVIKSHIHVLVE